MAAIIHGLGQTSTWVKVSDGFSSTFGNCLVASTLTELNKPETSDSRKILTSAAISTVKITTLAFELNSYKSLKNSYYLIPMIAGAWIVANVCSAAGQIWKENHPSFIWKATPSAINNSSLLFAALESLSNPVKAVSRLALISLSKKINFEESGIFWPSYFITSVISNYSGNYMNRISNAADTLTYLVLSYVRKQDDPFESD